MPVLGSLRRRACGDVAPTVPKFGRSSTTERQVRPRRDTGIGGPVLAFPRGGTIVRARRTSRHRPDRRNSSGIQSFSAGVPTRCDTDSRCPFVWSPRLPSRGAQARPGGNGECRLRASIRSRRVCKSRWRDRDQVALTGDFIPCLHAGGPVGAVSCRPAGILIPRSFSSGADRRPGRSYAAPSSPVPARARQTPAVRHRERTSAFKASAPRDLCPLGGRLKHDLARMTQHGTARTRLDCAGGTPGPYGSLPFLGVARGPRRTRSGAMRDTSNPRRALVRDADGYPSWPIDRNDGA